MLEWWMMRKKRERNAMEKCTFVENVWNRWNEFSSVLKDGSRILDRKWLSIVEKWVIQLETTIFILNINYLLHCSHKCYSFAPPNTQIDHSNKRICLANIFRWNIYIGYWSINGQWEGSYIYCFMARTTVEKVNRSISLSLCEFATEFHWIVKLV